jgi:hypothetical protein
MNLYRRHLAGAFVAQGVGPGKTAKRNAHSLLPQAVAEAAWPEQQMK